MVNASRIRWLPGCDGGSILRIPETWNLIKLRKTESGK